MNVDVNLHVCGANINHTYMQMYIVVINVKVNLHVCGAKIINYTYMQMYLTDGRKIEEDRASKIIKN